MPRSVSRLAFVVRLVLLSIAWPGSPDAATLTVTDLGDNGSAGQLRSLINAAAPGDTIAIPPGTISLAGALSIANNLTIQGAGAGTTIIDGGKKDRVFGILPLTTVTVAISNVTIQNGVSAGTLGSGIRNIATLSLTNVIVRDNLFTKGEISSGGGIFNSGSLTLTDVTVTGNTSNGAGGGISNDGGEATLTNVTVSGNTTGLDGGGLFNRGIATLTNVTVSGNTAANVGGGISTTTGTATLTNVILSGNTASVGGANCSGAITSRGHNLDSGTTCGFTGPGDLTNTDAKLGPLQNNGGPTLTQALPPGSPAIDAGTNAGCPPTDQRGVARPQGAACDIGAYELAASPTLMLSLNQPAFHSGNVLHVGLRAENPTPVFNADFYFGLLLPDGVTVCFITNLSPLMGQCLPLSASPGTFPPLAANIQVPQALDVTVPDLMVHTFGGGEPQGAYSLFVLLTPPGAFADGTVNPGDIIAVGLQPFTFSP